MKHLTAELASFTSTFVGGGNPYRSWQQRTLTRIQAESSIIETTYGLVEYQITGEGPEILYAHGTPGGYDQGLAFVRLLRGEHYTFISPSRPGYLRTPLEVGTTPEAQADLYAALLDALEIQKVSVIGFSGGGPSALQFALRHPERCRSLVMLAGIVQCESEGTLSAGRIMLAHLMEQLIISDPFIYSILPFMRLLPAGDAIADMFCSGAQFHLRKAGYRNDLLQFATLEQYPLEKITAPTLVVHGTADADVPFENALCLVRTIPHVTLLAITGGDHTAFYTRARTVMPFIRDFLDSETDLAHI